LGQGSAIRRLARNDFDSSSNALRPLANEQAQGFCLCPAGGEESGVPVDIQRQFREIREIGNASG